MMSSNPDESMNFFLQALILHLKRIRRGAHRNNPFGAPGGGPKVPPGPYAEKNFVSEMGVQTTQNALICLDPLS